MGSFLKPPFFNINVSFPQMQDMMADPNAAAQMEKMKQSLMAEL